MVLLCRELRKDYVGLRRIRLRRVDGIRRDELLVGRGRLGMFRV